MQREVKKKREINVERKNEREIKIGDEGTPKEMKKKTRESEGEE